MSYTAIDHLEQARNFVDNADHYRDSERGNVPELVDRNYQAAIAHALVALAIQFIEGNQ